MCSLLMDDSSSHIELDNSHGSSIEALDVDYPSEDSHAVPHTLSGKIIYYVSFPFHFIFEKTIPDPRKERY